MTRLIYVSILPNHLHSLIIASWHLVPLANVLSLTPGMYFEDIKIKLLGLAYINSSSLKGTQPQIDRQAHKQS